MGLRVEVHERVPRHQQVDFGDRRILDEVVAAEDHRAAQVLSKREVPVRGLEVALAQLRRHVFDLLRRVHGVAADVERLVVDVRGVDLHASPEGTLPQRLGEHHCEAVRLLSGGAAGRPDPHPVGLAGLQDPRDDLLAQEIPGDLVAEESRDVDEDRVEEVGELFRRLAQVGEVVRVSLDPLRFHPLADPPCEARTLVPREIEAAVGPDELDERIEILALLELLVHCS